MYGHVSQEGDDGEMVEVGIENEVDGLDDQNVKRLEGSWECG